MIQLNRLSLLSLGVCVAFLLLTIHSANIENKTHSIWFDMVRFIALPISVLIAFGQFGSSLPFLKKFKAGTLVLVIGGVFLVVMSSLKLLKLRAYNYEFYDFGLYLHKLSVIHNANWSEQLELVFNVGHVQPVLIVFSLICDFPGWPQILLVLQSVIFTLSIIPVYKSLNLSGQVNAEQTVGVTAIYFLNPFVSFNDILGFHPECLVFPSVLWAYYFFRKNNIFGVVTSALILSLVSEQWIALASSMLFGFAVMARLDWRYLLSSGVFGLLFFLLFRILILMCLV